MADIRCPMCAKPNPAEAETCWSCQARLKPLTPNDPAAPGGQGDAPDWLSGLRGGSGEASDWQDPSAGEAEPGGDTPDWLARIRQQQSEDASGEEEPDWLKAFSADEGETPAGEQPAQPEASAGMDWLGALRSEEPGGPSPAQPGAEPQDDEADWMAGLASWSAPFTPGETAPESETPPAAEPPAAGEDQGWLGLFQTQPESKPETPSQMGGEDQDWLATLGLGAQPSELTPADATPAQSAGEELDWLSTLGQSPEPAAETPAQSPASPAGEDIDWLSTLGLSSEETGAVPSGSFTPGTPPVADGADWLSSLSTEPAGSEPQSTPDGGLSDWSGGLNLPEDASSQPSLPVFPLEGSGPAETPFGGLAASSYDEEPGAQPGETPDWLKTFGEQPEAASAEPPAQPGETPDWLGVFHDQATPSQPSEPTEMPESSLPFAGSDLPTWLGPGEETGSTEKPAETATADNLEAAQLPGWLQAMRPVEAVAPIESSTGADDQAVVKAGPLAGMVGILPGEAVVSKTRRPPVYSAKLRVSENQRLQATLLEQMLSEEAKPRPARAERSHVPERIIRLLIALLLLVVTGFPLVTATQVMPLPDLFPPETVNFRARVEALPENAPVLLAVDYEPGLSEEMSLASASVIDHLIARKARLALLSTTPTGPVLADAMLSSAAGRNPGFQTGSASVNLGFLPGGTAGLQEFASRPQVALQYQLNGETAWDHPVLAGVTDIRKFAAVIVLTENAETARAWIEQVQPRLDQVPLLFVISAQSAPFIHPYLDSDQVAGMVEGMAGGIAYARIAHQPASAAKYWDSYQFGLFAAVTLLLLGGIWQLIRSLVSRKPDQKGA